jgi:hypothetical protein
MIPLDKLIFKVTGILGLYSYMNSNSNYSTAVGIGIVGIVLFLLYLWKNIMLWDSQQKNAKVLNTSKNIINNDSVNMAQMMYFTFMFLTMNMRWGNRISYYYLLFVPFVIGDALSVFCFNGSKKGFRTIVIVLLYAGFIWVMMTAFGNVGYQWSLNFRS